MVTKAGYDLQPTEQDAHACGRETRACYGKLAEYAGHPKVKAK